MSSHSRTGTAPEALPRELRRRVDRLEGKRSETRRRLERVSKRRGELEKYLSVSEHVTQALEALNEKLFRRLLELVEQKITIALQEVLEQPITFHAEVDFKRGAAAVEFWIDRNGNREDVYRGQGGSVANVASVGLRMFALTTQDEEEHRRFLVLDEQDCWLRPALVPMLVKIVHDAGRALSFQVLMISHHDTAVFDRYADKVYRFVPVAGGAVRVEDMTVGPAEAEPTEETRGT
ncbi:MAG: DNA repair protein [Spirochaetia bacterium]